jgi:hypothetical protein
LMAMSVKVTCSPPLCMRNMAERPRGHDPTLKTRGRTVVTTSRADQRTDVGLDLAGNRKNAV